MKLRLKTRCPYCHEIMGFICKCGAYQVTDETSNLPQKSQPYINNIANDFKKTSK